MNGDEFRTQPLEVYAFFSTKKEAQNVAYFLEQFTLSFQSKILPIQSMYRWKGEVYQASESCLVFQSYPLYWRWLLHSIHQRQSSYESIAVLGRLMDVQKMPIRSNEIVQVFLNRNAVDDPQINASYQTVLQTCVHEKLIVAAHQLRCGESVQYSFLTTQGCMSHVMAILKEFSVDKPGYLLDLSVEKAHLISPDTRHWILENTHADTATWAVRRSIK